MLICKTCGRKFLEGEDLRYHEAECVAPDYRALLELARTNPHCFVGTEHGCKLCGNEAGDVIHRDNYRALAVELAKALAQAHEKIQQYARPDFYAWLLMDYNGQQSDPIKRAAEALALIENALLKEPQ